MGDTAILLTICGMVILGSLANALAQLGESRKSDTVYNGIDFLISTGISIFAGVMFSIGACYMTDDVLVIYGMAGAGSFMGVNRINKLADMLLDFIANRARIENDK